MILTLVTGEEDWDAVYINGALKIEGHSVHPRDLAELIADHAEPLELWSAVAPTVFLNENGYPTDLKDCQFLAGYGPKRYEGKR